MYCKLLTQLIYKKTIRNYFKTKTNQVCEINNNNFGITN